MCEVVEIEYFIIFLKQGLSTSWNEHFNINWQLMPMLRLTVNILSKTPSTNHRAVLY